LSKETPYAKVLFGTQDRKNAGIGKMQELRCHASQILWELKTQERFKVAIWIAGLEMHRNLISNHESFLFFSW
jgi:hypothetical protein